MRNKIFFALIICLCSSPLWSLQLDRFCNIRFEKAFEAYAQERAKKDKNKWLRRAAIVGTGVISSGSLLTWFLFREEVEPQVGPAGGVPGNDLLQFFQQGVVCSAAGAAVGYFWSNLKDLEDYVKRLWWNDPKKTTLSWVPLAGRVGVFLVHLQEVMKELERTAYDSYLFSHYKDSIRDLLSALIRSLEEMGALMLYGVQNDCELDNEAVANASREWQRLFCCFDYVAALIEQDFGCDTWSGFSGETHSAVYGVSNSFKNIIEQTNVLYFN